ncbi:imidazole glycerol phosphate synthase subunit HisH [Candidatus Peregrinibacteria bacterium]|nr:imidazole glycerol phosphate synthase subunit HisH [Candidatus Peregrinibacteria bacterium]
MIAIIDYGMGNLRSIAKAIEYVGGHVLVTDKVNDIKKADKIILPGIGAFRDGIAELKKNGLDLELKESIIEKGKPFLGICLGMQMLAKRSYEFGEFDGLGFIDAEVVHFNYDVLNGLKVPHVGWNDVIFNGSHILFRGIPDSCDFYFVHSYHLVPSNKMLVAATCNYGVDFVAAIHKDNIFATQFHPEKSQKYGLKFLENFINWQC